ncbi:MAG: polyphosphate kinase 2 family protein [Armatimonadetes bacterium]|nr:polyphosphate kinase 2 family protein [Armatimonadota bacterium]
MELSVRVKTGDKIRLHDIDPGFRAGLDKEQAAESVAELGAKLGDLTNLLYAAGTHSLLVVLQGRDTSGKDGLIRRFLTYINAQSCRVASFKQPTSEELAHDYLWRIHAQAPARGSIALFNRSHYEDVLVVRVHGLVTTATCRQRFVQINAFEELMHRHGTVIVKLMLHISDDEQKERLLEREADPTKSWKLDIADWEERKRWPEYEKAYEEAMSHCSPAHAPWRIVPADRKWFRDLAALSALVEALEPHRDGWMKALEARGREQIRLLAEYRAKEGAGAGTK